MLNKETRCTQCGKSDKFLLERHELHGGKLSCASCGAYVKWTGKEATLTQRDLRDLMKKVDFIADRLSGEEKA